MPPVQSVALTVVEYSLEIARTTQKEPDALEDSLFARIDRRILALADDPRPIGPKKLKGYKDTWRIRIGDWRAIHIVDDAAKLVRITRRSPARGLRAVT